MPKAHSKSQSPDITKKKKMVDKKIIKKNKKDRVKDKSKKVSSPIHLEIINISQQSIQHDQVKFSYANLQNSTKQLLLQFFKSPHYQYQIYSAMDCGLRRPSVGELKPRDYTVNTIMRKRKLELNDRDLKPLIMDLARERAAEMIYSKQQQWQRVDPRVADKKQAELINLIERRDKLAEKYFEFLSKRKKILNGSKKNTRKAKKLNQPLNAMNKHLTTTGFKLRTIKDEIKKAIVVMQHYQNLENGKESTLDPVEIQKHNNSICDFLVHQLRSFDKTLFIKVIWGIIEIRKQIAYVIFEKSYPILTIKRADLISKIGQDNYKEKLKLRDENRQRRVEFMKDFQSGRKDICHICYEMYEESEILCQCGTLDDKGLLQAFPCSCSYYYHYNYEQHQMFGKPQKKFIYPYFRYPENAQKKMYCGRTICHKCFQTQLPNMQNGYLCSFCEGNCRCQRCQKMDMIVKCGSFILKFNEKDRLEEGLKDLLTEHLNKGEISIELKKEDQTAEKEMELQAVEIKIKKTQF